MVRGKYSNRIRHLIGRREYSRITWENRYRKMQGMYDDEKPRYKALQRLWRIVQEIRPTLQSDQSCLDKNKNALLVEGVIYAIYSCVSKKIYVGQTINSALKRFQSHIHQARSGSDDAPFHKLIRSLGYKKFFIFPLEYIPPSLYPKKIAGRSTRDRVKGFQQIATPREQYWIEKLHSYMPIGYNVRDSRRKRHRPHRKNNPMIFQRLKLKQKQNSHNDSQAIIEEKQASPTHTHINVSQAPAIVERADSIGALADIRKNYTRIYGYHDYHRRVKFLIRKYESNSLHSVDLSRYKLFVLGHMQQVLIRPNDFAEKAAEEVLKFLRAHLVIRIKPRTINKEKCDIIRLQWTTNMLKRISLKNILCLPNIKQLIPIPNYIVSNVRIVRKLTQPISTQLFNYTQISRKLPQLECNNACPCRRLFDEKYRPNNMGVLTGDITIVQHTGLRLLISYGPRFRVHIDNVDPMVALKQAIDEYTNFLSSKYKIDSRCFKPFIIETLDEYKNRLDKQGIYRYKKTYLSLSEINYLKWLQRYLVLVPVDKASNNVAFICKRLYIHTLRQELGQVNGAYTHINISASTLHEKLLSDVNRLGFKMVDTCKMAYLYWLPKLHKNPISHRFIAGSANCPTTKLSSVLSILLMEVLKGLREKDDTNIIHTGIRRFFVIQGYEEVADFFRRFPRTTKTEKQCLYTGDFSTMYTTIPHNDLIEKLTKVFEEVWQYMASKDKFNCPQKEIVIEYIDSTKQTRFNKYVGRLRKNENSSDIRKYTLEELCGFVKFLIDNIYVVNGDNVYQQTVGIPMGTNCAPSLANLYLYFYESTYIDILKVLRSNIAANFHMTFRLIDDILSVDNSEFIRYASMSRENGQGGIYPSELKLNNTSISNKEVNYVGIKIVDRNNRLILDVFDKRREFNFNVVRYPHMLSLMPTSIPYGVFIGQLHRFYRICTLDNDFINNALLVASILISRGCSISRLRKIFRSFLVGLKPIRWRGIKITDMCRRFGKKMGNYL